MTDQTRRYSERLWDMFTVGGYGNISLPQDWIDLLAYVSGKLVTCKTAAIRRAGITEGGIIVLGKKSQVE